MAYQFGSSTQQARASNKRRMDDDEPIVTKRYFDLHTQFSPDQPISQKNIPAITYASPDYRPPPPTETPLWLQPVAANSPMTEDDSEDDSALLTPSHQKSLQLLQQQQQQQQQVFGKPAADEYLGDMVIDSWQ